MRDSLSKIVSIEQQDKVAVHVSKVINGNWDFKNLLYYKVSLVDFYNLLEIMELMRSCIKHDKFIYGIGKTFTASLDKKFQFLSYESH